jgi:hypothetical protein
MSRLVSGALFAARRNCAETRIVYGVLMEAWRPVHTLKNLSRPIQVSTCSRSLFQAPKSSTGCARDVGTFLTQNATVFTTSSGVPNAPAKSAARKSV